MLALFDLVPIDFNLVKRILTSFSNLHYCDGILYDLNNSRVHELRGENFSKLFNLRESILLFTLAGNIAEDKTVMFVLHTDYMEHLKTEVRKRKMSSLHAFIKDVLNTDLKIADFKKKVFH